MSTLPLGDWTPEPPAPEDALLALSRAMPTLSAGYFAFLRASNGGEGELAAQPYWFVLWPAEQVLPRNRNYQVEEACPGFFAFGSSGGGELLAFDLRHGSPHPVVCIPFIPLDAQEACLVAPSFTEFVSLMGKPFE